MRLLTTLFSLLPLFLFAQKTSVDYLDMYLEVTERNRAMYERTLVQDGDKFTATIKLVSGAIKAEGVYTAAEDELIPDGYFTFYYANGQKESEGNFKRGYKTGTWMRYMMDGTERQPKYYQTDLGNMLESIK